MPLVSIIYISSKDVPGRLPTALGNRPWTPLLDKYHRDHRHTPVAVTIDFSTPDDGGRKLPKHVE